VVSPASWFQGFSLPEMNGLKLVLRVMSRAHGKV